MCFQILWLLEEGLDVNARDASGQTPLHIAVTCTGLSVVRALLNVGADSNAVDISGRTPLHMAALIRSAHASAVIAELIKHKAGDQRR